jgi:hypothetical protein
MRLLAYLERHHERFGVALFVVPTCGAVLGLGSLVASIATLIR